MARMYPDPISPNTRSQAEVKLYAAFKDQLPDDFAVFHSVSWQVRDTTNGVRDGEADFCLAHPDAGILIVEVKGGRIRYDGHRGRWFSNQYEIKDPFQQGRTAKYSLLDKLKERSYWSNRWTAIGYAVAFPDVMVKHDLRLDAPRELILDATDMADVSTWVDQATDYLRGKRPDDTPLRCMGIDELIALLSPTWDLRPVVSAEIQEERQELQRLTEEQFVMLDFLGRRRRVAISGCAGSGKTTLAIEKGSRLAQEGFDVLLMCFNRNLAEYLAGDEDLPPGLDVANVHRLASDLVRQAGMQCNKPRDDHYFDEFLPNLMVEAVDILGSQYDAIIVDEGQDIHDNWWLPLQYLLRDFDNGIVYVFFDDNQNLYRSTQHIPLELAPFPLTRNCRNTQYIHEMVTRFYTSDHPLQALGPQGRPVEVYEYRGTAGLKRVLSRTLHRLTAEEGISPFDIVILTPKGRSRSQLWKLGSIGGWQLTDEWTSESGVIFCSTIHSFKGLESPVVILAEIEPHSVPDLEMLLYVGCSRACNHLVLLISADLDVSTKSRFGTGSV